MPSDQVIAICILGVFALVGLKVKFFDRFKKSKKSKYATR